VDTIVGIAVIAAVAALAYWYADSRSAREVRLTDMAPEQIIRRAVQEIGAERRWTATGHSRDYASFAYRRHASCLVSLLLLLLFVIPGIVYALVYRKTQTLTINVFAEADGTSTVAVSGSGGAANARGRRFLDGLPEIAPAPAASAWPDGATRTAPPPAYSVTREAQAAPAGTDEVSLATIGPGSHPRSGVRRCVECGSAMSPDHRFCGACGSEQPA
jgi:hypothetical protein